MKLILNESEKNQISSQHEEIDSSLFNFLMRRIKINKRDLGSDWFDDKKLTVTEYTFEGFPGYGFNTFNNRKQMEYKIVEMLVEETDIVGEWFFGPHNVNDPKRQKFIKTIRNFLNFILSDKK
jgi:hypothetical protein